MLQTSKIASQNINRNLRSTEQIITNSAERVSTGQKHTKMSDGAAEFAIGIGFKIDASTYQSNLTSTVQARALLGMADGAYKEILTMCERLKFLAVQAQSGANAATEIGYLNAEARQLVDEIDRMANDTNFNGLNLIARGDIQKLTSSMPLSIAGSQTWGGDVTKLDFQVGLKSHQVISIELPHVASANLFPSGIDLENNAKEASKVIDEAINKLKQCRATVGAYQSRFDSAAANLATSLENAEAARSAFLDADIPSEMAAFGTAQVLLQTSVAMLAHINALPQQLLKLVS